MSAYKPTLEITAKTDTGKVRDANEDNFVVTQDCFAEEWILPKEPYINSDAGTVLVVADGMGGLNAGEVASKIAVDSIKEYFIQLAAHGAGQEKIRALLLNSIANAHNKIVQHSKNFLDTEGMGSTIVVAWIKAQQVHISWVGDSRCYVYRNAVLQQLSKDHSFVQGLVDKGEITDEQAFFHPDSNIITKSLGDGDRTPKPDYACFTLQDGDTLLLCSDGLNAMLQDKTIEGIIAQNQPTAITAELLVEEANSAGGHDNITVVLATIAGDFKPATNEAKETGNPLTATTEKKTKKNRLPVYALISIMLLVLTYFLLPFLKKNIVQTPATNAIKKSITNTSTPTNTNDANIKAVPKDNSKFRNETIQHIDRNLQNSNDKKSAQQTGTSGTAHPSVSPKHPASPTLPSYKERMHKVLVNKKNIDSNDRDIPSDKIDPK